MKEKLPKGRVHYLKFFFANAMELFHPAQEQMRTNLTLVDVYPKVPNNTSTIALPQCRGLFLDP